MVKLPTVYFPLSVWEVITFNYLLLIGWTILKEDYLKAANNQAAKDKLLPQKVWLKSSKQSN